MGEITTPYQDETLPLDLGDLDTTNLTVRAAKGVSWGGLFQVLAQPITLLTTVVLARLLTPSDFGLMSMAGIVVGLIALLNELGLGSAVVQKQDLTQKELSSLFWFNLAVGAGFTGLGIALAWPVSWYFRSPVLAPILVVLSIGYTIGSISTIHSALLMRRMEFRTLSTYGFVATVVTAVTAVTLGAAGAGVWSLAISALLGPIGPVILTWRHVRWRPSWAFNWASCKRLVRFGANVTLSSLFNYGSSNIDYIVIGRVLGASALGAYTFAFNLMLFPMRKFSTLLINATYPAFSRIQDDRERFRRAYLRSSGLLAVVAATILMPVFVAAPEIIVGLYGGKWIEAILPLQILVAAGLQKSIGTLVGIVFRGMGRPEIEARWSLVNVVALVVGVLVGVRWGAPGVAAAVSVVSWTVGMPVQINALRLIDARVRDYAAAILPGIGMGLAGAVAAFGVKLITGSWPELLAAGAMGGAALAASAFAGWIAWRPVVQDFMGVFRAMWRSKYPAKTSAVDDAESPDE